MVDMVRRNCEASSVLTAMLTARQPPGVVPHSSVLRQCEPRASSPPVLECE